MCPEDMDCCCLSNILTCSLQGSAGTRLYAGHDRTSTSPSSCVSVGDCRRETRHLVNVRIMTMAVWRQSVNWVLGSLLNLLHSEVTKWRKGGQGLLGATVWAFGGKGSGYLACHQVYHSDIPHSADTVHLCVWEHNDYCRIWHYLIRFFNRVRDCLPRGTNWIFKCIARQS